MAMTSNSKGIVFGILLLTTFFFLLAMVEAKSPVLTCTSAVEVESGDTCTKLAQTHKVDLTIFQSINPNLNCSKLFVGQWVCICGTVQ